MSWSTVPVECEVLGQKGSGTFARQDLSSHERMIRAARSFAIGFGVTFVTVFIPILHFILVPLGLILTGVFTFTTYMERGQVKDGEVVCPNCGHKMSFGQQAESWPLAQRCGGCSSLMTVRPVGR